MTAAVEDDFSPVAVTLASGRIGWGRGLVASLPRSLRLARGMELPGLVLIDGREDWTAQASEWLGRGTKSMLIVEPAPAEPRAVAALADAVRSAEATLDLAETIAGNPAIAGFRDYLGDDFAEIALDARDGCEPDAMLLALLRLARAIGAVDMSIDAMRGAAEAFIAEGRARRAGKEVRLRLTGAVCAAIPATYRIVGHGPAATARLMVGGAGPARPARVSLATPDSLKELPAIHESAHRHALRAVIRNRQASHGAAALQAFSQDMMVAKTVRHTP